MSPSIFFASSNKNKFKEAKKITAKFGIRLKFLKCHLREIQANTLEEIALHKATQAFSICANPVIVEDDGLFIKSLNGFPGPYSSFVSGTLGNKGILRLVSTRRDAYFRSIIAFCAANDNVQLFSANVNGWIPKKELGRDWGFDPIFIPSGMKKSFSQLREKNHISHRYLALKKFSSWYLRRMKSNDQ
jgi:XTP/dITP diphosphohydrolase